MYTKIDMSGKTLVDVMISIVKIANHLPIDDGDQLNLALVSGAFWRAIEHDDYLRNMYEDKADELLRPVREKERREAEIRGDV